MSADRRDSGDWPDHIPKEHIGVAEVTIDLDPNQYERLHTLYLKAVGAGYTDPFHHFAMNNTAHDVTVRVDGAEVDPHVHLDEIDENGEADGGDQ